MFLRPARDKDFLMGIFEFIPAFEKVVGIPGESEEETYEFQKKLGELLKDVGVMHLRLLNSHPDLGFSPNYGR